MRCPKCDKEMFHQDNEPDVNVRGGWCCTDEDCDTFVPDEDVDDDEPEWGREWQD